ncbi:hypothetical protein [Eggerthella lenta]|uniref:Lipoprotein n=2 Tax=Eggerthella lenta TaxID=84112 RepID=A0A369MQE4_EGGLN|nr:hypothetical protein [Eggerthella lenta]MDU6850206.1 hypothetical protein [Eggerthella sp.]MCQ4797918.1 hypothetical protein [Eggerthella lenta]MCQ5105739.1 hypothetical protein [Eggerthella lenta]MDB1766775.1 hypothetical protein [Eggerthella lenta]MDB1772390.1 hypothetical protein [Eggerthella lenta]
MRKNGKRGKVIAVAAAGALVVLLASTIARCAAAGPAGAGQGAGGSAPEQAQQQAGPAEAAASTLEAAAGTSWVAEDGSGATLQVTDRSLVESATDGTVSALAYSAADEAEADGQAIVTLTLEDGSAATLIVTLEDGEPAAVASDAFSAAPSYVASEGGGGPFEVTGLDERYLELVGGDEDALRAAIGAYAARRSPQASSASFDGEVFLDLASGMVSATFHLDDNASTIVTVQWAGGAFTVL